MKHVEIFIFLPNNDSKATRMVLNPFINFVEWKIAILKLVDGVHDTKRLDIFRSVNFVVDDDDSCTTQSTCEDYAVPSSPGAASSPSSSLHIDGFERWVRVFLDDDDMLSGWIDNGDYFRVEVLPPTEDDFCGKEEASEDGEFDSKFSLEQHQDDTSKFSKDEDVASRKENLKNEKELTEEEETFGKEESIFAESMIEVSAILQMNEGKDGLPQEECSEKSSHNLQRELEDDLEDRIDDKLKSEINNQGEDQLEDHLYDNLGDELVDEIEDDLEDDLEDDPQEHNIEHKSTASQRIKPSDEGKDQPHQLPPREQQNELSKDISPSCSPHTLEEKIVTTKNNDSMSLTSSLTFASKPYKTPPPSSPAGIKFGEVICRGSISQYDIHNGESACTPICFVAAPHLLRSIVSYSLTDKTKTSSKKNKQTTFPLSDLEGNILDDIVNMGVSIHGLMVGNKPSSSSAKEEKTGGCSSIEEFWNHPALASTTSSLIKGDTTAKTVELDNFRDCLELACGHARRYYWMNQCDSSDSESFSSLDFPRCHVATIFTKPPETVLCLGWIQVDDVDEENVGECWYLFDSHGESNRVDKVAFLMKFDSIDALALALSSKFPKEDCQDNMFEATPLVMVEDVHPSSCSTTAQDLGSTTEASEGTPTKTAPAETKSFVENGSSRDEDGGGDDDDDHRSALSSFPEKIACSTKTPKEEELSHTSKTHMTQDQEIFEEAPARAIPSDSKDGIQSSSSLPSPSSSYDTVSPPPPFNMEIFRDPLTSKIMADPVICKDGNTYERTTIEHHFRIHETITSPITQQVLPSDCLVPNMTMEKQIERMILDGVWKLPEDEKEDWVRRREEKAGREVVKENEKHEYVLTNDDEEEEGMTQDQEIFEEAPARAIPSDSKDEIQSSSSLPSPSSSYPTASPPPREVVEEDEKYEYVLTDDEEEEEEEGVDQFEKDALLPTTQSRLSELVALDRRQQEILTKGNSLGVSVALCDESCRIPHTYILQHHGGSDAVVRCMVTCCAKLLPNISSLEWCSRCGRIACESCLEFRVTRYNNDDEAHAPSSSDSTLHQICAECVMQITDVMPQEGAMGQTREFLLNAHVEPYLDSRRKYITYVQDSMLRQQQQTRFGDEVRRLEDEVERLVQERDMLQKRAAATMAVRGEENSRIAKEKSMTDAVHELEVTCADLSTKYRDLVEKKEGVAKVRDDDTQLKHVEALSDVEHKLEVAQMTLGEARSRLSHLTMYGPSSENEEASKPHQDIKELERRYNDLTTKAIDVNDENAIVVRAKALSEIHHQLEASRQQQQSRVAAAANDEREYSDSIDPEMSVKALEQRCSDLEKEYEMLSSKKIPSSEREQIIYFETLSDVENKLQTVRARLDAIHRNDTDNKGDECDTGLIDAIMLADDRVNVSESWVLPLGLNYPTKGMEDELELIKNQLERNFSLTRRNYKDECNKKRHRLIERKENLEMEVEDLSSGLGRR